MLHIQRFVVNMVQENTYLVWDDTLEAVFIDCGAFRPDEQNQIEEFVSQEGLKPKRLLQTHSHFDHVMGAQFIYETYGLQPEMHSEDIKIYNSFSDDIQYFLRRSLPNTLPPIGPTLKEGDELSFGTSSFKVIATPGHTPGGVCFHSPKDGVLFSGDSIFYHEIGRTDFPGGSYESLITNLKNKVLTLPEDVEIFPGHGAPTTVAEEKARNPYLRDK